ncbi:hypothetical protein AGMMS49525_06710 [Bacteroidia bacterium]|nr:hypothetical protein AGMMS49525_06710 [Bacteroidia bacterium]
MKKTIITVSTGARDKGGNNFPRKKSCKTANNCVLLSPTLFLSCTCLMSNGGARVFMVENNADLLLDINKLKQYEY